MRDSETEKWSNPLRDDAVQVAAGDIDADGMDDLVGWWPGLGLWVRYSGDKAWVEIQASDDINFLTAGDMNGDGCDDMLGSWSSGV